MRSLFVRIFVAFMVAIVLASLASVALFYYEKSTRTTPHSFRYFASRAMTKYGEAALDALQQGGPAALAAFTRELREKEKVKLILFDHNARPILQRPRKEGRYAEPGIKRDPARLRPAEALAKRTLAEKKMVFQEGRFGHLLSSPIYDANNRLYIVVIRLVGKSPGRPFFLRGMLPSRLGILLVVAGIACYLLARSLTSPIRKLRTAAQQFASGDLSARIGNQIKGKNEIAELARDFDHMAERIESLMGGQKRLLRDISHELRSPLARLNLALGLARQNAGRDAEKSLDRIERESDRLNELIGQLLTLTLLESGTDQISRQEIHLQELIKTIVADADFEAQNLHRRVTLLSSEPIRLQGTAELLHRAIENVVRNAVRHTGEGTSVEIALRRNAENKAVIDVRDHGPGVPEALLEHLFEPFYRVEEARDRKSGGTGIGLAITERSIRLHGGSVKAQNVADGGLLIQLTLPA